MANKDPQLAQYLNLGLAVESNIKNGIGDRSYNLEKESARN